jgi:hypothetical protein
MFESLIVLERESRIVLSGIMNADDDELSFLRRHVLNGEWSAVEQSLSPLEVTVDFH